MLGDPLQRVREVLPDEALADPSPATGRLVQDEVEDLVQERLALVDVDAASRDLDRGRHNIAPRQTSVPAVDFFQSSRRPGTAQVPLPTRKSWCWPPENVTVISSGRAVLRSER